MIATFGVGQAVWSIFWFFLFFLWIMLVFQVFGDIFRSPDLSGGVKALWVLFVVVMPYLGVFVYLVLRGGSMHERQAQAMQVQQRAVTEYIRDAAGPSSPAAELTHLADLRDKGVIDADEFARLKAKVLA